jgi:hypothetical protein
VNQDTRRSGGRIPEDQDIRKAEDEKYIDLMA